MADRSLRSDIRRLVDEEVPAAPWLEDRVMVALREDAAGQGPQRSRFAAPRVAMATLAAVVIAVLAIGVLLGSHLARQSAPAPAANPTPSRDAAVVRYRELLDTDMNAIYVAYYRGGRCTTRDTCEALTMKTRDATEALLRDIAANAAPSPMAADAANVQRAAEQFVEQLDLAIANIQIPGSDFVAIAGAPSTDGLDLAVATVTCWPVVPVVRSDLTEGYGCTPQPTADEHS
jgi:hypothetical protein